LVVVMSIIPIDVDFYSDYSCAVYGRCHS